MKKYLFNISGTLTFTHENKDFAICGEGPHLLPEANELVISLSEQGFLVEVQEPIKSVKEIKKL